MNVIGSIAGVLGIVKTPQEIVDLSSLPFYDLERDARLGGSILKTTSGYGLDSHEKDNPSEQTLHHFSEGCKKLQIDALIFIGGDGSLQIVSRLAQHASIPFVAIPKTIDQDISATHLSIGHVSAVQMVCDSLDRLATTAYGHRRIFVVEVMGRNAGHLALASAIAGQADAVLLPECRHDWPALFSHLLKAVNQKGYATVVVNEAVACDKGEHKMIHTSDSKPVYGGIGCYLSHLIQENTGIESRFVSLGHVQRGGSPLSLDRILASSFGVHATDLVAQKKYDRLVVLHNHRTTDVPFWSAFQTPGHIHPNNTLLSVAASLNIYLGFSEKLE